MIMTRVDFIKDKAIPLLLNVTGMMLLSWFLFLSGSTKTDITIIVICWVGTIIVYWTIEFHRRKRYFDHLFQLMDELDRKYLFAEVTKPEVRLTDQLYFELLRQSNQAILEKVHEVEDQQQEYKEYLESWIHEVKTPLTSMELCCANNKNEITRKLQGELGKVENLVDMVLFYARSEKAYQDYLIHAVNIRDVVVKAIQKNKLYFLENQVQIDLQMEKITLSTDEKWLGFLLNQIFANAIKYKKEADAKISITTKRQDKNVWLTIEDNGIGIPKEDVKRVFEKGFTGKNGRNGRKSTGMGLYLCKRICDQLEIGIACESEVHEYTRIILVFPDSDYMRILQN